MKRPAVSVYILLLHTLPNDVLDILLSGVITKLHCNFLVFILKNKESLFSHSELLHKFFLD